MNGISPRLLLIAMALSFGAALAAPALAQQASADADFVAPHPKKPSAPTVTAEKPSTFDIAGIVAQAFNVKKPIQLINPLAPAKYGTGHDNVSWDPDKPEKPKGIILLGIQW